MVLIRLLAIYGFTISVVVWVLLWLMRRSIRTLIARRFALIAALASMAFMSVLRISNVIADGDVWDLIAALGPVVAMTVYTMRAHPSLGDLRTEWSTDSTPTEAPRPRLIRNDERLDEVPPRT